MKILNLLLWPFLLPILFIVYLVWPKARPHFSERLGLGRVRLDKQGYLLFHVASLGEARAARRLIDALADRVPLILTTMTQTGREALAKAHPDIPLTLAPLDLPGLWTPFLRSRRIRGILLFETEIWPSMLTSAFDLGLPVGIVNGRLSSRSFTRYKSLKSFVGRFLKKMAVVTAQSERDKERFKALGVPESRVHLTGNLKWDVDEESLSPENAPGIRDWLDHEMNNRTERPPLRLLGSSVHPGEARMLVSVSLRLSEKGRPIALILAPRHLDILPALLSDIPSSVKIALRSVVFSEEAKESEEEVRPPERTIHILNTYGELGAMTAFSDVVFVGGTLDPVGGHSPIEAAFHGKPILWGPHRDHIADLAEGLTEAGSAIEVKNEMELDHTLSLLFDDRSRLRQMGDSSRHVFESGRGPLGRTLSALSPMIETAFGGKG